MNHLRDYQREAISDIVKRWDAGGTRIPMVLATGLGKTEIFTALESAWITDALHEAYELGKRVLVIAHTDELIEQAARKARQRNLSLSVGIVKAERNEAHAQIVVSSRQTLASAKRREAIKNVGLIIVDEAHHALRSNTYGKILEHFGAFPADDCPCTEKGDTWDVRCPVHSHQVKVAGFTATLARGDKGKLSTVWEECTFKRDILFGIRHGYLLDVEGKRVVVPDLDMGRVRQTAGDYRETDIAEELERTFAPQIIAQKYSEVARDETGKLRSGIAFWPLVETAYHGSEAFLSEGIASAVIHGGLPKEERKLILKKFHAGEITVVHNCMVLTEGFDEPRADVVVIARPTRSAGLYQQMVGRVLRPDLTVPAGERRKALILDVVGAGVSHDLRSLIDLSPERKLPDAEDLSLAELEALLDSQELQEAALLADPTYVKPHDGETVVEAFDPLHRKRAWGRTKDGTFFMSAGVDQYVFLYETEPTLWDVVWCAKKGAQAGLTDYRSMDLEEALLWAEEEAASRGGKTFSMRSNTWRRAEPSEAQKRLATSLKIYREGMTKGECSEAIDSVMASRRIDPLVRTVRASQS